MKSRFPALAQAVLVALALLLLSLTTSTVFGQESEPVIVDEVVAQVNDSVITLSQVKRAMKEAVEVAKQQGMSEQQANDEITRHKPELIARLINEQLLLEKGKDLGLTDDVEAEVNKRVLEVAKDEGCKTIVCLDEKMRASNVDPAGVRQTLRTEIMKSAVLQREVDAKIFFGLSGDELKRYYEAHRDKFRKPESVVLSAIFLSLAGRQEADVRARATKLVAQARSGADFGALAAANSEQEQNGQRLAPETKGKVGTFPVPELRADFAAAIKNVRAGGVTDPIRTEEGYYILRVDERTPGSDASSFNENQVREAITMERSDKERTAYLQSLRNEAYIKLGQNYEASVQPLLAPGPAASANATSKSLAPAPSRPAEKRSGTKGSKHP